MILALRGLRKMVLDTYRYKKQGSFPPQHDKLYLALKFLRSRCSRVFLYPVEHFYAAGKQIQMYPAIDKRVTICEKGMRKNNVRSKVIE
jgi:hypothetical protein